MECFWIYGSTGFANGAKEWRIYIEPLLLTNFSLWSPNMAGHHLFSTTHIYNAGMNECIMVLERESFLILFFVNLSFGAEILKSVTVVCLSCEKERTMWNIPWEARESLVLRSVSPFISAKLSKLSAQLSQSCSNIVNWPFFIFSLEHLWHTA